MVIDERLTCLKTLENAMYSKKHFRQSTTRCYRCGVSLNDESSILEHGRTNKGNSVLSIMPLRLW